MAEDVKIVLRTEAQGNGAQTTEERLNRVTNAGKRAAEATQKATAVTPAPKAKEPEFDPNRPAPKIVDTWARIPKAAETATPAPAKPTFSKEQVEQSQQWNHERAKRDEEAIAAAQQKADAPGDPKSPSNRARQINLARAAALETALAQAKVGGDQDEIAGAEKNLRVHKLAMRFKREQGISSEEALEKAGTLVGAQTAAKQREAAEKAATKARVDGERQATREMVEQERIQKRMTIKVGSIAVSAGLAAAEQLFAYQSEMQGVGIHDTAARAINQRQLGILSGSRGTSAQAQAQQWATEDRIAERQQNRPGLEHDIQRNTVNSALTGAAGGAALGSIILPGIGTLVGAALGGAAGYVKGRMSGNVTLAEDKAAEQRDKDLREKQEKLANHKFETEEGGVELAALRHRSSRTFSGQREAQVDDATRAYLAEYRRLKAAGATGKDEHLAHEGASLKVENEWRDKQITAASGLVDARSGAGDIAAAASWSRMAIPGMHEVKSAIEAMHTTVRDNDAKANLEKFGQ